jgi:hypothetical protein
MAEGDRIEALEWGLLTKCRDAEFSNDIILSALARVAVMTLIESWLAENAEVAMLALADMFERMKDDILSRFADAGKPGCVTH